MGRPKYDFIIEAVHRENGRVAWVRGYRRRFVHYSDVEILPRETLLQWLAEGKSVAVGQRRPLLGNTFEIQGNVGLILRDGEPWIINEASPDSPQELGGVPEI